MNRHRGIEALWTLRKDSWGYLENLGDLSDM